MGSNTCKSACPTSTAARECGNRVYHDRRLYLTPQQRLFRVSLNARAPNATPSTDTGPDSPSSNHPPPPTTAHERTTKQPNNQSPESACPTTHPPHSPDPPFPAQPSRSKPSFRSCTGSVASPFSISSLLPHSCGLSPRLAFR